MCEAVEVSQTAGRSYQVFRFDRGGGRGWSKSKMRSENSKVDYRALEMDILFPLFYLENILFTNFTVCF